MSYKINKTIKMMVWKDEKTIILIVFCSQIIEVVI